MLNDKKKEFISEIHDNNAEKKQKEKAEIYCNEKQLVEHGIHNERKNIKRKRKKK